MVPGRDRGSGCFFGHGGLGLPNTCARSMQIGSFAGKTIKHYRVESRIGRGGMGVVYRAMDTRLERPVAMKFLPPHLVDAESSERFVQEARAASALDHPNICAVYDIGETEDGRLFIVMAYCDGEDLRSRLQREAIPITEAVSIARQVGAGLACAHAAGITHRDVKPANIIVDANGRARVIDFGVAKLAHGTGLTRTGSTVCTIAYMSPEQARGERVDHQTDVWALGVILYEMLTAQRPFAGEFEQAVVYHIINGAPASPASLIADIPEELSAVVMRALEKDRKTRWTDMQQFLDALSPWASPSGTNVRTALHPAQRSRRGKTLVTGTIALLAVAAATVVLTRRIGRTTHPADVSMPAALPDMSVVKPAASPGQSGGADELAQAPGGRVEGKGEFAAHSRGGIGEPAGRSTGEMDATAASDARGDLDTKGKHGSVVRGDERAKDRSVASTRTARKEPDARASQGTDTKDESAVVARNPAIVPVGGGEKSSGRELAADTAGRVALAESTRVRQWRSRVSGIREQIAAAIQALPPQADVLPEVSEGARLRAEGNAAAGASDFTAGLDALGRSRDAYRAAAARRQAQASAVSVLIGRYADAIGHRDTGELGGLYRRFDGKVAERWGNFFSSVTRVGATLQLSHVDWRRGGALADVSADLVIDGRLSHAFWRMHLVEVSTGSWLVDRVEK